MTGLVQLINGLLLGGVLIAALLGWIEWPPRCSDEVPPVFTAS